MENIKVLSLFDGMSCGRIALERAGIDVELYYASEIKKAAIKVSKDNYPDIIHIGDVRKISFQDGVLYTENGMFRVGEIDLLIGGSPCQDFSVGRLIAQKTVDGLNGDKSSLFYEYLRLLREINPKYFMLENVKMKKESEIELNTYLGVEGIKINSKLVSYQNRERIYWTNIPNVSVPEDRNINFQDFKEINYERCKDYKLKKTPSRIKYWNNGEGRTRTGACSNVTNSSKIYCLTRKQDRSPNSGLIEFEDFCRFLTRKELELAQNVPEGYTNSVSYSQAQDLLGDGWTVDVVGHIFSFIPKINNQDKDNNDSDLIHSFV